ncbi:HAD family hydrolase [Acidianus sulfidivorans]|nr:HAD family hydrolase [Acidianus sulfidivorans]
MKYAVWLDGVILDVDTTEFLYNVYKKSTEKDKELLIKIPVNLKVHEDWEYFFNELKKRAEDIIIMSPYDEKTTYEILNKINLRLNYIYNSGKTKPSREPFTKLSSINPLELVVIGSSPLDLLSARFYDSRIKVLCVKRYSDCSKYSPYLYAENLIELLDAMKRIKLL